MVTELLSQSINVPTPTASPGSDDMEPKLIQMLHAPLQVSFSLEELQRESMCDSTLTTLHTYSIYARDGQHGCQRSLHHLQKCEMNCHVGVMFVSSRGLCTVVPGSLAILPMKAPSTTHLTGK